MIVNDGGCLCEGCQKDDNCPIQRNIVYLQKVAWAMEPKEAVMVIIRTDECDEFKERKK